MVDIEYLKVQMTNIGVDLSEHQVQQFVDYYEMLIDWNEKINLTAITEWKDVVIKHFVDSVSLVSVVPELKDGTTAYKLIDVGTGAGFPGIPLKIVYPQLKIVLLDSLNKRINFLNLVIDKLGLENVEAVHGRAEDYARSVSRETFDLCVSRAVANLSTLSEYCLPFVKIGGRFISYKSSSIDDELEASKKAVSLLGGKIEDKVQFTLPESDAGRSFVIIRKFANCNKKYPRKAGLPSKEPLS